MMISERFIENNKDKLFKERREQLLQMNPNMTEAQLINHRDKYVEFMLTVVADMSSKRMGRKNSKKKEFLRDFFMKSNDYNKKAVFLETEINSNLYYLKNFDKFQDLNNNAFYMKRFREINAQAEERARQRLIEKKRQQRLQARMRLHRENEDSYTLRNSFGNKFDLPHPSSTAHR